MPLKGRSQKEMLLLVERARTDPRPLAREIHQAQRVSRSRAGEASRKATAQTRLFLALLLSLFLTACQSSSGGDYSNLPVNRGGGIGAGEGGR
jgi:hypothetical protein